jgi:hypothetical protein
MYTPDRKENERATPIQDLVAAGAAYANTVGAFNNFRRDNRNATNHGMAHGNRTGADNAGQSADKEEADIDLGTDMDLDVDVLAMDEEEFPMGTDIAEFVSMAREVIDELLRYK